MRNLGHEDGTIPLSEVDARRLDALIYREYLDPGYLIPKPDKLVLADVNEPVHAHRVPGTVIYAYPGDHLHIKVVNGDTMPHSFHVHGLSYGIESDGSWPFGTFKTCGYCADSITKAVRAVDAGAKLEVNLDQHLVRIEMEADVAELAKAIAEAGYTPVAVQPLNATAAASAIRR
jgi:copper chaperone CopZ